MSKNIEETSLEAHVRICQERYESLDYKLDVVDKKFASVEEKIVNLCASIEALKNDLNGTKTHGFVYVIGLLLTVLGYLLAKFVIV